MKRGTTILEYAMLIILIAFSIMATKTYIKRGFSGRWRNVGDTFGYGRQYDPNIAVCGDGTCDAGEDCSSCASDCGACIDCSAIGATLVFDGTVDFCRVSGSSCPAGWPQYKSWSTTQECGVGISYACSCICKSGRPCELYYCTSKGSGQHSWANKAVESQTLRIGQIVEDQGGPSQGTCSYYDSSCTAAVTEIGCRNN